MRRIALILALALAQGAFGAERYLARPGMYVSDIAEREYGSPHFASVIEKHNAITSKDLKPDTQILTPPLTRLLEKEGFPAQLIHAAARIESGFESYRKAEKALRKEKPAGQKIYKPKPHVMADLNRAIGLIKSARNLIDAKSKPTKPTAMIKALDAAIGTLDRMVRGRFAPDGSDLTRFYKQMADAYVEAIEWGRQHVDEKPNDTWEK